MIIKTIKLLKVHNRLDYRDTEKLKTADQKHNREKYFNEYIEYIF